MLMENNMAHKEAFLKGLKILLAEDDAINQLIIQRMFRPFSVALSIANNGEEALFQLQNNTFDIILMDVEMPVKNGFETTLAIRQMENETKRNIPIIGLTAHVLKEEHEKCINVGMNACLIKPLQLQQLQECLLHIYNAPA